MGKIIWTRPVKDWPKDRLILGDHDFIVSIPATIQHPTESQAQIPRSGICILTSTKTIDFMLAHRPDLIQSLKDSYKIACFGAKTAAAVKTAGLSVSLESKSRSLEELCTQLAQIHSRLPFVYIGAKKSAFDIKSFFSREKINFLHISLYETLELELQQPLINLLDKKETLLICVASPRATRSVLSSLSKLKQEKSRIEFLCIGETTAEPLQNTTFAYNYVTQPSIECMAITALEWYKRL